MNTYENSSDLQAGGLTLRLNFHDHERHREIKAAFPCLPGKRQRPVGTIAVHSPESVLSRRFDSAELTPSPLPAPRARQAGYPLPSATLRSSEASSLRSTRGERIPPKADPPLAEKARGKYNFLYNQGKTIDGNGQYDGMFDLDTRTGYVTIDGPSADLVLANFIRQVFTHLIIAHGGVILHSACVVKNGNAHIFYGTSGAGKSTICELSSDCVIASDDLTVLRKIGNRFLAWGMPGTEFRNCAIAQLRNSLEAYRIRAIFKLAKDTTNRLIPMSGAKAVAQVLALPRASVEPARIMKMLEFLDELTDKVRSYELHFRKDTSFWKCIEEVLGP